MKEGIRTKEAARTQKCCLSETHRLLSQQQDARVGKERTRMEETRGEEEEKKKRREREEKIARMR